MSESTDYKDRLVNWASRTHLVRPDHMARWHKGGIYNHFPDKISLKKEGLYAIAKGWLPSHPFISADTRVLAVGSCFARNFTGAALLERSNVLARDCWKRGEESVA